MRAADILPQRVEDWTSRDSEGSGNRHVEFLSTQEFYQLLKFVDSLTLCLDVDIQDLDIALAPMPNIPRHWY